MSQIDRLVQIVARLRGEGGCPWDRAQTPRSMRPYVVEEACEVVEAIDRGDRQALCAELGDLLFQVVLLARMSQEEGGFGLDEVCAGIADKMVERHPHVFRPGHVERDPGSVAAWERRKARERAPGASLLDDLPAALPALVRAHRLGEKLAHLGFDWPEPRGVRAKVDEELGELDEAIRARQPAAIEREYGDLLLAVATLGRFLGVPPEDALREATARLGRRFRVLERLASGRGTTVHEMSPEELDRLWESAKAACSEPARP